MKQTELLLRETLLPDVLLTRCGTHEQNCIAVESGETHTHPHEPVDIVKVQSPSNTYGL